MSQTMTLSPQPLPAPPPVIGVQRRRALCAAVAVKVLMEEVGDAYALGGDWLREHIALAKAARERGEKETLRGMPLSAGALRDFDGQVQALAQCVMDGRAKEGEAALSHWAALFVAAAALVVDANATARAVTRRKQCWRDMQESMDVIAEGLTEACPGCDIAGTSMYMEIAR